MDHEISTYKSASLLMWRRFTDVPLIALAIGSLPLLLLETVSERLSFGDRQFLVIVNVVVFVAFLIDYVVEIFLSTDRWLYVKTEWTSLAIVVSQGLALLPALGILGIARVVRALRPVLFIGRLLVIGASQGKEVRNVLRTRALSLALSVAGFVWITSAVGFTLAEDVGNGRRIDSFGDALWWSASTISTVGYGDIYPVTQVGRIIAVLTMIVGVSTFGVLTAKIASTLIRPEK
jgi:voltage-gated potassium channel